jgi:hypothetical protein
MGVSRVAQWQGEGRLNFLAAAAAQSLRLYKA